MYRDDRLQHTKNTESLYKDRLKRFSLLGSQGHQREPAATSYGPIRTPGDHAAGLSHRQDTRAHRAESAVDAAPGFDRDNGLRSQPNPPRRSHPQPTRTADERGAKRASAGRRVAAAARIAVTGSDPPAIRGWSGSGVFITRDRCDSGRSRQRHSFGKADRQRPLAASVADAFRTGGSGSPHPNDPTDDSDRHRAGRVPAVVVGSVIVIGRMCLVAVEVAVPSAADPGANRTTTQARAFGAIVTTAAVPPSRRGTIRRERPPAMGVTQEHPSRWKTAGFRGIAPGITRGAILVWPLLSEDAIGPATRSVAPRRPNARHAVGDAVVGDGYACDWMATIQSHAAAADWGQRSPIGTDCHECRAVRQRHPVGSLPAKSPLQKGSTQRRPTDWRRLPASSLCATAGPSGTIGRAWPADNVPARRYAITRWDVTEDRQLMHQSNAALR